ncbi:DUF4099 domain-containing protein [Pedobacter frigidisoli]|uniref:DUF4099 domain-containing protein n=1 Tax=Pedobacter frigidisoli TaxID=2530455 RepID=A0A4R0NZ40_9SPHI|nr:DUF4099 domain-containing protein [Pedobacter frigidisoli]TCD07701.1 DUF4099 domain-containing protein [Pedobacter frigidisoli]
MQTLFSTSELPLSQLEKLGIYHQGQLMLEPDEISALLSGRRTELIPLRELKGDGFAIERLDARLSLARNTTGEIDVLIHPIYTQVLPHPLLSAQETQELISGNVDFVGKRVEREEGRSIMMNFEYDPKTREFVSYDVSEVQAPDLVNGMLLSEEQRSSFRRGETLKMPDGTMLQHRASEPKGLRSDRNALILSVFLDGGISYMLLRGIRSISEKVNQLDYQTPAFSRALQEMQGQGPEQQEQIKLKVSQEANFMRGMSR